MKDIELIQKIDAFVAANQENILRDIKTLVDINSVEGAPASGAPFGPGPQKALDAALAMAGEMGLEAHNCEGYIGYADLPGKSEKQIAAITHLDVVPEGNGWTQEPFCMTIRDGYILGRGVADDKGPAVLTLYAAKFFKEQGEALPYTLRILLGANEETGMRDVAYYQQHFADPAFCFTPDGEFPVCYGEKGIFGGDFKSAPLHGNLVDFSGGVAGNVVPDRAYAVVKAEASALPPANNIEITAQEDGFVRIAAFGKGGHAAMPAGTVNAIGLVVEYLLANNLCTPAENEFLQLLQQLFADTDGSALGIASDDGVFDPLTCIGGTIKMENGVLVQNINIRFPTSTNGAAMEKRLCAAAAAANAAFIAQREAKPFYIDPNTPVIQTLIDTYNEVTGKNEQPFTMGGGTYARHFQYAVSFGMEETKEPAPEWVGMMHGPDEGVCIELLWKSLKIYILAIARLMRLPF